MLGWNESLWFPFAIGAAFKSTIVLGAAGLAACLLRGRSAAARHMLWTVAAVAVLVLPLLMAALPQVRLGGAGAVLDSGGWLVRTTAAIETAAPEPPHAAAARTGRPATPAAPVTRHGWRFRVLLAWAAGILAAALQLAAASFAMFRARRRAIPFADRDLVAWLAHSLEVDSGVEVLEDPRTSMPMAFGILRPAVYLPEGASEWPAERLRLVLLHELAHIRRRDTVTHWVARTALGLYWWNPAAWMAWRAFLRERERAADDLVLQAGARASEYASQLLEVARSLRTPALGCAAIAMARRSQLEGRLLAILDPAIRRRAPRRLTAAAAALLAIGLVAPLAAIYAQDDAAQVPPDIDATIRAANAQKNHEILDQAARAALAQGKLEIAKQLLDASVSIREQVSGSNSVDYGLGLVKLGDLAQRRGLKEEALNDYKMAIEAIGPRPEAAQALIDAGVLTFTSRQPEAAFGYFQQAQDADPAHAQMAVTWMALVRSRDPETVNEAELLYQRAITMGSPDSLDTAVTLDLYAQFLRQDGHGQEADDLHNRAAEIRANRSALTDMTSRLASSGVYHVGNGVTPPLPLYKPEPEYSEFARAAKLQGQVTLSVVIQPDGSVTDVKVAHWLGLGLDEMAIDAVTRWRFKPGLKDGVPVAVQAMIAVNFRLL